MSEVDDWALEILEVTGVMVDAGLVVGTWGNVSRRAHPGSFLITPSGIPYPTLQTADLVIVDIASEAYSGKLRPSTETSLHAAVYRARPDVGAIIHAHCTYASVFAVTRTEIPPVLEELAQLVGGSVQVARYASPGTKQLAVEAVAALAGRAAVLLANHGLVGVGNTLQDAQTVCQVVEQSAQVYLWAKLHGRPFILGKQEVTKLRKTFLRNYGQQQAGGDSDHEHTD